MSIHVICVQELSGRLVEFYFLLLLQVVCREGPERVKELIAMGASFDQSEDGRLHLAREGGHSHHRIVHAADMTGREIERALLTSVRNTGNITMFEHHFALEFLTRQVVSPLPFPSKRKAWLSRQLNCLLT